ncbi:MAG: AMP-dependent synthetase/ligase [bacterium]
MKPRSIYELLQEVCAKHAGQVAYRFKRQGSWMNVTWEEHQSACKQIAKSLIALDVQKGECVNILSQTRLEWVQCDFGIVSSGGVTVGIYPTNLAPDCAYIINHCEARIIFVENREQLQKLFSLRGGLARVRHLILYDGESEAAQGVLSWDEFLRLGQKISDAELEVRAQNLQPEDLAALVYTSGTTGVPKGVMLTHNNLLFVSQSASDSLYLRSDFITLLFLPMAHVFARLLVYFCLRNGIAIAFAESIEKVADNLKEVRPHFIASVPRIFEKIYTRVMSGVQQAGGLKARLFHWALHAGCEVSRLQQEKVAIPALLGVKHALANKLVLHKIQDAFGGRLIWAVSGAAPLNKSVAEFFHACGVLVLEGIGMTENSSFSNVNRYDHNKFGTVGPVGPGIEMKLAPDGEILFRGENVMKGYFKNATATAESIDSDGWLYSGDVGEIDADGFLCITDRKKDLIITAGGKNIAPQRIEKILSTSPFISQAMAFGDRKNYVTALITLNFENVSSWAKAQRIDFHTLEELARHPLVRELIEREVNEKNKELASFESVKKIRILPKDFSIAEGDLTPTLKVKRKVVTEKYRATLEEMY